MMTALLLSLVGIVHAQPNLTVRAGDMYIGQEATGIQPFGPDTGLAPGSRAGINVTGLIDAGLLPVGRTGQFFLRPATGDRVELPVAEWNEIYDVGHKGYTSLAVVRIPIDVVPGEWDLELSAGPDKTFTKHIWISARQPGLYSIGDTGGGPAQAVR